MKKPKITPRERRFMNEYVSDMEHGAPSDGRAWLVVKETSRYFPVGDQLPSPDQCKWYRYWIARALMEIVDAEKDRGL